MGISTEDKTFYILLLDDQVAIVAEQKDSSSMPRSLQEEYTKWGLTINTKEVEYLILGENNSENSSLEIINTKYCKSSK